MNRESKFNHKRLWLFISACMTLVLLIIMTQAWSKSLNVPYFTFGDSLALNYFVKYGINQSGHYNFNNLQYPFGSYHTTAQDGGFVAILFMLFGRITKNYGYTSWLILVTNYLTTTCFTYFALCELEISPKVSAFFALVYCFIPYHFLRIGHINLDFIAFVPIVITGLVLLATNKKVSRSFLVLLFSCSFLQGFTSLYMALFFLALTCFLLLISRKIEKRNMCLILLQIVVMIIGVILSVAITYFIIQQNNIDNVGYIGTETTNLFSSSRNIDELMKYGMRIYALFIPAIGHNVRYFDSFGRLIYTYADYWVEDNYMEPLSIIIGTGCLLAILNCLKREKNKDIVYEQSASCILFLLFLGMAYGPNLFLGMINQSIRSYNRVSILIGFLSVIVVAIYFQNYISMKNKKTQMICICILGSLFFVDEITLSYGAYSSTTPYDDMCQTEEYDVIDREYIDTVKLANDIDELFDGRQVLFEKTNNEIWFSTLLNDIDTNLDGGQEYNQLFSTLSEMEIKEKLKYYSYLGYEGLVVTDNDGILEYDKELGVPLLEYNNIKCYSLTEFAEDNNIDTDISKMEATERFYKVKESLYE